MFASLVSQAQIVRTALYTKQPTLLTSFYERLGMTFSPVEFEQENHWISGNSGITILDNESVEGCLGGLIVYEIGEKAYPEFKIDPFSNSAICTKQASSLDLLLVTEPSAFYTLFRTSNLSLTKLFYESVGSWQEEKHGEGPLHFSFESSPHVIEIYPLRKQVDASMEIVVECSQDFFNTFREESDQFEKKTASTLLFRDPDSRLVQLRIK